LLDRNQIVTYCLDSSYVITLIDSKLARSLNTKLLTNDPIPVKGIGSYYISSYYVYILVFFTASSAIAKIIIEAYLVDELNA